MGHCHRLQHRSQQQQQRRGEQLVKFLHRFNIDNMVRFFAALLFVAVAISTSESLTCTLEVGEGQTHSGGKDEKDLGKQTPEECVRLCNQEKKNDDQINGITVDNEGGCWCERKMRKIVTGENKFKSCYLVKIPGKEGLLAPADPNHQLQDFGKCGHHVTKPECESYAAAADKAGVEDKDVATDPYGCYQVPGEPNTYFYNDDATAKTTMPACSATKKCVCDKLIGAFKTSTISCDSLGFAPVFTYSTDGQTQDVVIAYKIGTGKTNNVDDTECVASKTGKGAIDI